MAQRKSNHRLHKFLFLSAAFAIMLLTAVLAFEIIGNLTNKETNGKDQSALQSMPLNAKEPEVKHTSINLIYGWNSETLGIETVLLEILNSEKKTLDYICIPVDTGFMISTKLYKKLSVGNTAVPQMVQLSELYRYYKTDQAYQAGQRMLEELLKLNINYHTALSSETLNDIFRITGDSGEFQMSLQPDMKNKKQGSSEEIITKIHEKAVSDLTMKEKLKYVEDYDSIQLNAITFHNIEGNKINAGYQMDELKTRNLINQILYGKNADEETKTTSQN